MPLINGVGQGDQSADKQNDFRSLLSLHVDIVDRMTDDPANHWRRKYTFVDMNAGPGIYSGITGSPLIFLDKIEQTSLPYRAVFVEKESVNADALKSNTGKRTLRHAPMIITGDHETILRQYVTSKAPATYGLLYHDPSGSVPNFDLLADVSSYPVLQYMEIMIYLSATNIKRVRRYEQVTGRDAQVKLLTDYIRSIQKSTWIIRKPQGRHQWTFALGSNWKRFPAWENLGFYRVDSPAGQDILRRLTYTDSELEAMNGQQSFFDSPALATPTIAPMPST